MNKVLLIVGVLWIGARVVRRALAPSGSALTHESIGVIDDDDDDDDDYDHGEQDH